jgi:succinyl-CoA synthetase alpha subunit
MSILIDERTRVVVQGITGRDGSFHARSMLEYGTQVVAGVTPGKGGGRLDGRVPIFDTVKEAVRETEADTSVIYVPAAFAADAILEAAAAEIGLIVCITEGIPVADMVTVSEILGRQQAARLIGPNCPGLISPGKSKVGIMPGTICLPGRTGLVSRSGTLTYEVVKALTDAGIGQSTCIGIGGDPIVGTSFVDVLALFAADVDTDAVVVIGEIGGTDEQEAADFIRREFSKPVVAFIAGQSAPPGRRMGHAGAIVSGSAGTAEEKIRAFAEAGVTVAKVPSEIPALLGAQARSPARVR